MTLTAKKIDRADIANVLTVSAAAIVAESLPDYFDSCDVISVVPMMFVDDGWVQLLDAKRGRDHVGVTYLEGRYGNQKSDALPPGKVVQVAIYVPVPIVADPAV